MLSLQETPLVQVGVVGTVRHSTRKYDPVRKCNFTADQKIRAGSQRYKVTHLDSRSLFTGIGWALVDMGRGRVVAMEVRNST